ncbi:hypothetical protein ACBI99_38610 [Nonomuraea sp. ATR24]|uniref:hypothetical protein n=1 Tax=Nonomuraea TaxID=83681 RepID=UPI001C5F0FFE|nr:hypothetical protein [Nonomuraea ceibae]
MSTDDPSSQAGTVPPPLVSPCPHTPACPPPVCLPPTVRAQSAQTVQASSAPPPSVADPGGGTPSGGYEVDAWYVRKFAGTMGDSAIGVDSVKQWTPRFEGWHLAPMAGIPIVGLMFVNRLNTIADTWRDSAGILTEVLRTDSGKISTAAANYVAAQKASTIK